MSTRQGMAIGLLLHVLEGVQGILLIPLFARWLPAHDAAFWVALTTGTALVPLALAGHYQPLIRSISGAIEAGAATGNAWPVARRRTLRVAGWVLLGAQLLLLSYLAAPPARLDASQALAGVLFMTALHLRLRVFAECIVINGVRAIGRDKALLAAGSAANLVAAAVLSAATGSVACMGAGYLMVQAILLWAVRGATAPLARPTAQTSLAQPSQREVAGLLLLNLGGYLNLGTDVAVANRWLAPELALQYAFWSRLFAAQLAVVGLWTQLRFPFWAAPGVAPRAMLRELARAWMLLAMGCTLLLALALAAAESARFAAWRLHPGMLGALAFGALCAGGAIVAGQALTALRRYRFVGPSIVAACASPVLAALCARWWAPQHFVLGYVAANVLLCAIGAAALWQEARR